MPRKAPPFIVHQFTWFPVLQRKGAFISSPFPVSLPLVSRFLSLGRESETSLRLSDCILPSILPESAGFNGSGSHLGNLRLG